MSDGFPNKPKILKGAFVEYGISLPPLFVVFQFNPEQLSRSRSVNFTGPGGQVDMQSDEGESETLKTRSANRSNSLRELHQREFEGEDDLLAIRSAQNVTFTEETIAFDIRLDATEDLNEGNAIVGEFGILPQLSTLELMMHPKSESVLGNLVDLLGSDGGFSFTNNEKPPIVLFMWGYTRVLPVNITSMSISETEFNTHLAPTRATVSVNLTVIEGKSVPYTYSKVLKESMSVLNLANITDLANVVVPG
ncbi:hypothetical protein [Teredinibacter purpureus]|uniref:hypothetical protein n=1 Tax=Teredinibacter purpureus TaxID=2731756 RepID=UPI0005F780DF|nr:hypothetical protein [Teredinibacter purpureus]